MGWGNPPAYKSGLLRRICAVRFLFNQRFHPDQALAHFSHIVTEAGYAAFYPVHAPIHPIQASVHSTQTRVHLVQAPIDRPDFRMQRRNHQPHAAE